MIQLCNTTSICLTCIDCFPFGISGTTSAMRPIKIVAALIFASYQEWQRGRKLEKRKILRENLQKNLPEIKKQFEQEYSNKEKQWEKENPRFIFDGHTRQIRKENHFKKQLTKEELKALFPVPKVRKTFDEKEVAKKMREEFRVELRRDFPQISKQLDPDFEKSDDPFYQYRIAFKVGCLFYLCLLAL